MITSVNNKQVRELLSLMKRSKERKKQNAFIVEGARMVKEVLQKTLPEVEILHIYVSESFWQSPSFAALLAEISQSNQTCRECVVLSDHVYQAVSDTVTPQGILAVTRVHSFSLEEILPTRLKITEGSYLLLENIQDPGNLGTMIRTAEAAGVSGVVLSRDCADLYSPKVVRSTMGSIFRVPVVMTDSLSESVHQLKAQGVVLFAAHLDGKQSCFEADLAHLCGFLIGNEGNGLQPETAALADTYLQIPMAGQVESLNASMAAGILLYESYRQRKF